MTKIDDLIENLNGFGKYQKIRYILICLSGLFPPIASYMHSFIAASPKYSCENSTFTHINDSVFYSLNYYYSEAYQFKCLHVNSIINDPKTNTIVYDTTECHSWHFDKSNYQNTLTEEWGLVCDHAMWRSNMQSIYYSGLSVGSIILTKISKRHGQKPVLYFSLLIIMIGGSLLRFGPQKSFGVQASYILLVTGRFMLAIGSHAISINGYLLAMETIGRSKRGNCALVFEFFFSIGQLVLVFAAYFSREWRQLTLIIILPCVPFFLFICFSHESLTFLAKKKRYNEVQKILGIIAKTNKTKLDQADWKSFLNKESERCDKKTLKTAKPHFLLILVLVFNWIINNFVFHGLGLRSNDLGINPYVSFCLSAVVELFCSIFTFKILHFNARRKPYFFLMLLTGACCTTIYFSTNPILTVITALIAKFSISASYAIIRYYSSEFFHENLRSSYLSKCTLMARTGSVIAPFITGVGDYRFKQLPFLIFGIFCFVSAITSVKLPRIEYEEYKLNTNLEINRSQILSNNWMDGQEICNDDDGEDDQIENTELATHTKTKEENLHEDEDAELNKEMDALNNENTSSV